MKTTEISGPGFDRKPKAYEDHPMTYKFRSNICPAHINGLFFLKWNLVKRNSLKKQKKKIKISSKIRTTILSIKMVSYKMIRMKG